MQQQYRDRLDAFFAQTLAGGPDVVLIQRLVDIALGKQSFMNFEPERALDQGDVFLEKQVIGIGPVDAPDLVYVAKALCDQQGCTGARAFQHRIDGDRGAVQENVCIGECGFGLGGPGGNAVNQGFGCRERFAEMELPGRGVEGRDICECAADIGGEPYSAVRFAI